MAGTTRSLEDVILEQYNYVFSLDGKLTENEKSQLDGIKKVVEKIRNLSDSDAATHREKLHGAGAEYWLDLRRYNPTEMAKNIKQPMLILQGGRDYQVTRVDFDAWKKALSSRKDVEFRFYPKLNHLFFEGKGKITPAEYQKTGHVAKRVVGDIAEWMKRAKNE